MGFATFELLLLLLVVVVGVESWRSKLGWSLLLFLDEVSAVVIAAVGLFMKIVGASVGFGIMILVGQGAVLKLVSLEGLGLEAVLERHAEG